jgi:hypothetical protein
MRCAHLLMIVLLLAGCAPAAPHWVAEAGAVYCYRTIADPDCYRQPRAGAERRLIAAAPQLFFTVAPVASAAE